MSFIAFPQDYPPQVGMSGELYAEQVVYFALLQRSSVPHIGQRRHRRIVSGAFNLERYEGDRKSVV
jgi:hypothetical protein